MIRKILGVGAIVTAALVPAGLAQAGTSGPPARSTSPNDIGPVYICTNVAPYPCIAGQGVGNQVTLEPVGGGASLWTLKGPLSNGTYEIQNNNGHCLYLQGPAKQSRVVEVSSCDLTQGYEQWFFSAGNAPFSFQSNNGTGYYLANFNPPRNGQLVFGLTQVSGHDTHWNLVIPSHRMIKRLSSRLWR